MKELICKGPNDVCRIFHTEQGYEIHYNLIWDGDPKYVYDTLRGAKIAMARMAKGRYLGCKPSTAWE